MGGFFNGEVMEKQEKIIINAAIEISSNNDKIKKDILKIYNSAPDTFRKIKTDNSFLMVDDIDSTIKIAQVLKEGRKENGLARKPILIALEKLEDWLVSRIGVPDNVDRKLIDCLFTHYRATKQYKDLLNGERTLGEIDTSKEDREILKSMHERPFFAEVSEAFREMLVDRENSGAFYNPYFQYSVDNGYGVTSISFNGKLSSKFPLHEIRVGGKAPFTKDSIEEEYETKRTHTMFNDHKAIIRNLMGREVIETMFEWNLHGINGYQTVFKNPLTTRDAIRMVELAYCRMEAYSLDYHRVVDLTFLISYLVMLYREWVFQNGYKRLVKTIRKGTSPKAEHTQTLDTVTERIDSLEEENEVLKRKLMAAERNEAALKGSLKEANKIIYDLNSQIPKPEPIEKVMIAEPIVAEPPKEESEEDRLARFNEFVNGNDILVWGCRESYARKMEKEFPKLTFMGNREITREQINKYDFIVLRLDFTSHTTYYKVKKTVDTAGIPTCHMQKGSNGVMSLVNEVLRVVDRSG